MAMRGNGVSDVEPRNKKASLASDDIALEARAVMRNRFRRLDAE